MKLSIICSGCLLVASTLVVRAAAPDATPPAAPKPEASLEDLLPDTVLARGKNFEIKRSQLDQAIISTQAAAAARNRPIPANQRPQLELQALEYLIQIKLLDGVATADDKAKGQAESDKLYEALKTNSPSEEVMIRELKAAGLTPETYRQSLTEKATAKAVLLGKANITSDDIKKFYEQNPDKFEKPEAVKLCFITVGQPDPTTRQPLTDAQKEVKKKLLQDLRDRAVKGEDFEKLARENSEDGAAKQTGGEMTIVRGMPQLPQLFEETAFSLKTNQISDIISTQFGFHLLKMIERIPAGKAKLEEASPDIRDYLEGQKIQQMMPSLIARLRKDAGVEILDAKLKDLDATVSSDVPPDATNAPASRK